MKFYSLKINDIRHETADCVSIAFDVPDELKSKFQFVQGQYLTLKANIEGEEVRRSYSLCTSPLENEWRVAIKKVTEGVFSTFANEQLAKGMLMEVGTPEGRFFPPSAPKGGTPQMTVINETNTALNTSINEVHDKNNSKTNAPLSAHSDSVPPFGGLGGIFFASGSGITPILSILKTALYSDPTCSVTLIYGNRTAKSVIFREEIEGLKNKFMGRFRVIYILSRERVDAEWQCGRIDTVKVNVIFEKIIKENSISSRYFICGPESMTKEVISVLEERNVPKEQVHFELFGAAKKKAKKNSSTDTSNPIIATAQVKLDGVRFDVPMREGENVLDAALAVGADLPFACKGGVCCTCRAKLLEGAVEMEVNYALDHHEVEAGFILTCQAKPTTAHIVVDFDVK
jgi:ring-1,2-phenylacetyl-CoA epoxidase subunit PaaE